MPSSWRARCRTDPPATRSGAVPARGESPPRLAPLQAARRWGGRRLAAAGDDVVGAWVRTRTTLRAVVHAAAERAAVARQRTVRLLASSARSGGGWVLAQRRRDPLPVRPLVTVALLLVCGGWVAALAAWPVAAWLAIAVLAIAVWGGCRLARAEAGATVALAAAIVAAMAGWTSARLDLFPRDDLAWSLGDEARPVAVEGLVVESARAVGATSGVAAAGVAGERSESVLAVTAARDLEEWHAAGGRARLIVAGAGAPLVVGSRVRVFGRALRPPPALNPGEFDQRRRARLTRVLSVIRTTAEAVEVIDAPPWSLAAGLDAVRTAGTRALREHVSPARAGLAAALLLGSREAIGADLSHDFLVTGTVHILSISGLHVGILAAALAAALRIARLPRAAGLALVAAVTGGYCLMVGAQTPVVRATLVVWLACLGAACGRPGFGLNSLAVAAIIVALWHPAETLLVGTQLSFLSTAVLVGVVSGPPRAGSDPIERLIDRHRSPAWRWCRRRLRDLATALLAGAAVWLVTLPLVAARFHVVSPVALVLNPLLAPLVALAMGWGFLCLVTARLSAALAAACGSMCDAALAATEGLVAVAAAVPYGHAWIAGPPEWWVVGAYGVALLVLVWLPPERLRRPATWALVALVWGSVGLVGGLLGGLTHAPSTLEAVVASMGHGCGIVVRGPSGRCLVYDAGRLGAPAAAGRGVAAVLWERGITRIDTLVVSHADSDHFNGVPDLLDRFAVGRLVVPAAVVESPVAAVRDLLARAAAAGVEVTVACAGDTLPFEAMCRVSVLHPDDGAPAPLDDDNQSSIVLAIEAAGRRLLLTGDLDGPALERFVAGAPGRCDALVAPHHGSLAALATGIVAATTPEWVVVSGTGGDRWPTVRDAYADASGHRATVLRSGADGAIAIVLTADSVTVRQHRGGRWHDVPPAGDHPRVTAATTPAPRRSATAPPRAAPDWRRGT